MMFLQTDQTGFTLIEIIVTLILVSVLGTMMYSYFNSALDQGVVSTTAIQKSFDLHGVMENITADYHRTIQEENIPEKWQPLRQYKAGADAVIAAGQKYGHIYKCIQSGVSGVSEPDWLTKAGAEVTDGSVKWQPQEGPLNRLLSDILASSDRPDGRKNNSYGGYWVKEADFITFTDNSEAVVGQNDPDVLLKVTIRNDSGETLTALFTAPY